MAKKPNMTAAQVDAYVEQALTAGSLANDIAGAVMSAKIDEIPNAVQAARNLIVASRNLNNAALALLRQHEVSGIENELKKSLPKQA